MTKPRFIPMKGDTMPKPELYQRAFESGRSEIIRGLRWASFHCGMTRLIYIANRDQTMWRAIT